MKQQKSNKESNIFQSINEEKIGWVVLFFCSKKDDMRQVIFATKKPASHCIIAATTTTGWNFRYHQTTRWWWWFHFFFPLQITPHKKWKHLWGCVIFQFLFLLKNSFVIDPFRWFSGRWFTCIDKWNDGKGNCQEDEGFWQLIGMKKTSSSVVDGSSWMWGLRLRDSMFLHCARRPLKVQLSWVPCRTRHLD